MAANDYLTMGRVRAVDYTIPDVCDNDAADLIKHLLVRHFEVNPVTSYSVLVQTIGS